MENNTSKIVQLLSNNKTDNIKIYPNTSIDAIVDASDFRAGIIEETIQNDNDLRDELTETINTVNSDLTGALTDQKVEAIEFTAGRLNGKITVTAGDGSEVSCNITQASGSEAGLMSASDKSWFDTMSDIFEPSLHIIDLHIYNQNQGYNDYTTLEETLTEHIDDSYLWGLIETFTCISFKDENNILQTWRYTDVTKPKYDSASWERVYIDRIQNDYESHIVNYHELVGSDDVVDYKTVANSQAVRDLPTGSLIIFKTTDTVRPLTLPPILENPQLLYEWQLWYKQNESKNVNELLVDNGFVRILNSDDFTTVSNRISRIGNTLDSHIFNINNPHNVTAEQLGLGNVENLTKDEIIDGLVTQDYVDEHIENTDNPHNVTAEQLGLGKVENLTKNEIIDGLASQNSLEEHINDTGNPHGVTAEQLGLGKVENLTKNEIIDGLVSQQNQYNALINDLIDKDSDFVYFDGIVEDIANIFSVNNITLLPESSITLNSNCKVVWYNEKKQFYCGYIDSDTFTLYNNWRGTDEYQFNERKYYINPPEELLLSYSNIIYYRIDVYNDFKKYFYRYDENLNDLISIMPDEVIAILLSRYDKNTEEYLYGFINRFDTLFDSLLRTSSKVIPFADINTLPILSIETASLATVSEEDRVLWSSASQAFLLYHKNNYYNNWGTSENPNIKEAKYYLLTFSSNKDLYTNIVYYNIQSKKLYQLIKHDDHYDLNEITFDKAFSIVLSDINLEHYGLSQFKNREIAKGSSDEYDNRIPTVDYVLEAIAEAGTSDAPYQPVTANSLQLGAFVNKTVANDVNDATVDQIPTVQYVQDSISPINSTLGQHTESISNLNTTVGGIPETYVSKADADNTYATQTDVDAINNTLGQHTESISNLNTTVGNIPETYVSKTDADNTYATQTDVDAINNTLGQHTESISNLNTTVGGIPETYVSKTDANNTYATQITVDGLSEIINNSETGISKINEKLASATTNIQTLSADVGLLAAEPASTLAYCSNAVLFRGIVYTQPGTLNDRIYVSGSNHSITSVIWEGTQKCFYGINEYDCYVDDWTGYIRENTAYGDLLSYPRKAGIHPKPGILYCLGNSFDEIERIYVWDPSSSQLVQVQSVTKYLVSYIATLQTALEGLESRIAALEELHT